MRKIMEGSHAVAETVRLCRPQVIAAYPSTPQTHINEHLARYVADGELAAEFLIAESEFAALSIALGAVAGGSRAFTATSSQGLLSMSEVLYNIAGMRLPLVMICANRAIGAPINIFNDHQDSMSLRDAGWIQLYVSSNQEAVDTIVQAYRIAESSEIPVMVCMDGFYLTHTFEPVEIPEQAAVKDFLGDFKFSRILDPKQPYTLGAGSDSDNYQEFRMVQHKAIENAATIIKDCDSEFSSKFGRGYGGLLQTYRLQNAQTVLIGLGSLMGATSDVVDTLRSQGHSVGALRIRSMRPFPTQDLIKQLASVDRIIVFDKAFSAGAAGIVATELRAVFQQAGVTTVVESFIGGLGGRDLTPQVIIDVFKDFTVRDTNSNYQFTPSHKIEEVQNG